MRVYEVVFEDVEAYEADEHFVGIFSSREKAEEAGRVAIEQYVAEDGSCSVDDFELYVREFELDKMY